MLLPIKGELGFKTGWNPLNLDTRFGRENVISNYSEVVILGRLLGISCAMYLPTLAVHMRVSHLFFQQRLDVVLAIPKYLTLAHLNLPYQVTVNKLLYPLTSMPTVPQRRELRCTVHNTVQQSTTMWWWQRRSLAYPVLSANLRSTTS